MQSSTPTGQFPHPKHSVHALKPMIKVLLFGHTRRKPKQESPDDPAYEWSIDLKYPCLGLIAAGIGTFTKRSGLGRSGWPLRRNQEKKLSIQLPADIQELLAALLANRLGIEATQLAQRLGDRFAGDRD